MLYVAHFDTIQIRAEWHRRVWVDAAGIDPEMSRSGTAIVQQKIYRLVSYSL